MSTQTSEAVTAAPDPPTGTDWDAAVRAVLLDPLQPQLVFQPIVDLRRGVVAGYEALSRFSGPPRANPDEWFAAADRLGVGAELEARVVRGRAARPPDLPPELLPHGQRQPAPAVPAGAGRSRRGRATSAASCWS